MISFIQKSGIVTAMVGVLHAPSGTKLYKRLAKENRLTGSFGGNNTDYSINFTPKMNPNTLTEGYREIVSTIYSPKQYYERVKTFLREYRPSTRNWGTIRWEHVGALFGALWMLGVKEKGRTDYWKLMTWTVFKRPRLFPVSMSLAIYGFHFRKVAAIGIRS
jgi:hypothetical protein